jgi:hypothetical protein
MRDKQKEIEKPHNLNIIRVCGWCNRNLCDNAAHHRESIPKNKIITHGICADCANKLKEGFFNG